MYSATVMAETYEANRNICRYVHATSRGHEAIQLATALHLTPIDWVSPYYRDESMLLGMGWTPYELMLQLLAKKDDPFSGGKAYYSHPNSNKKDRPKIIHQSSATGMQAIPTTGVAQGVKYLEGLTLPGSTGIGATSSEPLLSQNADEHVKILKNKVSTDSVPSAPEGPEMGRAVVVCSLGDASLTEGEVSEALQFAVLKKLPIIYLVQDNEWGISVSSSEGRAMNAYEFAKGFKGLNAVTVDGTDFLSSYNTMHQVINHVREYRQPWLVHAKVCLLGHHTSGVRKEMYRSKEDLEKHASNDPLPKLRKRITEVFEEDEIKNSEAEISSSIQMQFQQALAAEEPDETKIEEHVFVSTPVTEEKGERRPVGNPKVLMVDAALFAIREIMEDHKECILFGQDVGMRLGGVFREAATLADQFGSHRVFNTAIQEAYIIGSTVGLSATGVRPIVEVQFADYIYPGFNQLVSELSKSCFLTEGKFPVSCVIRVPVGAYGGGGPYHSACVETTLLSVKGIKIAYPSNAADMKGLMKAAFYDPNPVIMLEHKGIYWGKVPGTEEAKTTEPSRDYILPLGKAGVVLGADEKMIANGESACIITYGMGVYWANAAAKSFDGKIEIIDLRTLFPLDEDLIFSTVKKHGRCLILTEEQQNNSFAEALAGRISTNCFQWLDAPVQVLGALNLPAVPMNTGLEAAMLPDSKKVVKTLTALFAY
jgi:2-oxoisovalerate dehydrogenase E1 component